MDRAVLDLLAFYRRDLRETEEGREALAKLGIHSPVVVDHFALGYGTGKASEAASEEQCAVFTGLGLAHRRHEKFRGCVVVPVQDENGQVVDICGLKPWPSGVRLITWQEPMRGLIGASALQAYAEVVLTENVFLALHVRQHGFANVVALRKPVEIEQHLSLIERSDVQRVYLVARRGRPVIVKALSKINVEVVLIKVPPHAVVIPKESLDVVGKTPPAHAPAEEVKLVARTETRLCFSAGRATYRIEAAAAVGLGMRVQVRAELGGVSFIDRLDVASAAARRKFGRACGIKLGIGNAEVESHLTGIAGLIDSMAEEEAAKSCPAPKVLTPAEDAEVMDVLKVVRAE